MTESVRLAKYLAELVSCSRSEAEQYITGGWVTVDGAVVEELGFRVQQHKVELLPQASLAPVLPVTVLLHKPAGVEARSVAEGVSCAALQLVSAATLAPDDRSGMHFLKRHVSGLRLTMPLETEAAGLLVFTQDWRIIRKLIDDAAQVEQEYIVEVAGELAPDGLALLNHGLSFNRRPLPPIKVSWQSETRLRFAVKMAQLGLIAHMCEQVGLSVLSMKRIRIGRVPMAALPSGQWRYLLGYERF